MIISDLVKEYLLIFKYKYLASHNTFQSNNNNTSSKVAVFLVGFSENNRFLENIEKLFRDKDYAVYYPIYNTHEPVEVCFEKVKRLINEKNLSNVLLLGHSKGGLIARYCLLDSPTRVRIKNIITIATPHKGSIFGYLKIFSLYELAPNSKFLNFLNNESVLQPIILNIFPRIDNHVIPNRNLKLDNATNIEIDIVGHTRILESDKLLLEIEKLI
jgi:pimeloyl-ACP methyl ester carboxylesterase